MVTSHRNRWEGRAVTTIDLVRHAQSRMNLTPGLIGGRSNHSPLSPQGRVDAERLGHRLGETWQRPDALFCTSAVRSRETAQLIVAGADWRLPLQVEDGLLELSQGAAEGQRRDLWWTPDAIEAMRADPLHHRLAEDGESHEEVQQRTAAALRSMARQYRGGHVVAVGHGGAMRTLVWWLIGGSHDVFRGLAIDNLDILRFDVDAATISYRGRVLLPE